MGVAMNPNVESEATGPLIQMRMVAVVQRGGTRVFFVPRIDRLCRWCVVGYDHRRAVKRLLEGRFQKGFSLSKDSEVVD